VTDALRPQSATHSRDDIVRRRAGGFVDDQEPVHQSRWKC
jgi:hypothetical protein